MILCGYMAQLAGGLCSSEGCHKSGRKEGSAEVGKGIFKFIYVEGKIILKQFAFMW